MAVKSPLQVSGKSANSVSLTFPPRYKLTDLVADQDFKTQEKGEKMADFKEGDIVQLKSGGPKMTVKAIDDDGEALCQWFSGSKLQQGFFEPHTLTKEQDTSE